MSSVNCEGLPKEVVFVTMYNNAKPQGIGLVHFIKT